MQIGASAHFIEFYIEFYRPEWSTGMRQLTILNIEDNSADQVLLSEYASEIPGVYVRFADSLLAAVKELRLVEPDVIFLDLGLPDSGGLNGLKILEAMKVRSKIIVLSDRENFSLGGDAVSLGASDYVFKSQLSSALLREILSELPKQEPAFATRELNWRAEHTKRSLFHALSRSQRG